MKLEDFKSELEIATPVALGSKDKSAVKRIQEWLCYHGNNVVIDGEFGPATEAAVVAWRGKRGFASSTGAVPAAVWLELVYPMCQVIRQAIGPPTEATLNESLGTAVARIARIHLLAKPIEIGGENRGPWVRLYMKGNEGKQWPWCAGFTSFVLLQACDAKGLGEKDMPVPYRFGCDELAGIAKQRGLFVSGETLKATGKQPQPGWLFLVRNAKSAGKWLHIGIAETADFGKGIMTTIEGNTNDNGSAEGYAVCRRIRAWGDKDFIRIG